jgi:hypothetical protein
VTDAITAGAAVAAAVFSLVNVLLSNRHARMAQVRQWRRESMKEAAAKFLNVVAAIDGGAPTAELLGEAEVLVKELDLIASAQCADAGRTLYEFVIIPKVQRRPAGILPPEGIYTLLRLGFLNQCRKDLGVDRLSYRPSTSSIWQ